MPLFGTWFLKSCEHHLKNGQKLFPFGESPQGLLIYTPEMKMSVMISAVGRNKFASAGLFEGSLQEKATAAETFVAYSGKFEILSTEVLHHVEMSLFPNWVGTIQRRFYKINASDLILSTAPFISNGAEQTAHLIWRRLN